MNSPTELPLFPAVRAMKTDADTYANTLTGAFLLSVATQIGWTILHAVNVVQAPVPQFLPVQSFWLGIAMVIFFGLTTIVDYAVWLVVRAYLETKQAEAAAEAIALREMASQFAPLTPVNDVQA